eukprot:520258-Hanusia_phi.AAC.1
MATDSMMALSRCTIGSSLGSIVGDLVGIVTMLECYDLYRFLCLNIHPTQENLDLEQGSKAD